MRIVTRPDFDGIVCAVLLFEALDIKDPVIWVEPSHVQKGLVDIQNEDIIANLPYDERCALWFDHHYTNQINTPFKGAFKIAPSAAGIIFDRIDKVCGAVGFSIEDGNIFQFQSVSDDSIISGYIGNNAYIDCMAAVGYSGISGRAANFADLSKRTDDIINGG